MLATILVSRRDALVGGLTGDAARSRLVDVYHQAVLGAVALSLIGFVAAAFIRDVDAAPTMVRSPRRGKAAASAGEAPTRAPAVADGDP